MTTLFCTLSLLVGFLIGVVYRDALDLLRSGKEPIVTTKPKQGQGLAYWTTVALLLVAFVANACTGAFLLITRENATKYAECTAHWQQGWAKAYSARYSSSVKVGRSLDKVIEAVAEKDAKSFEKAIANYTTLRAKQAKARSTHPLPALPSKVCGPPNEATR